jgi:hypothetical protein
MNHKIEKRKYLRIIDLTIRGTVVIGIQAQYTLQKFDPIGITMLIIASIMLIFYPHPFESLFGDEK